MDIYIIYIFYENGIIIFIFCKFFLFLFNYVKKFCVWEYVFLNIYVFMLINIDLYFKFYFLSRNLL